NVVYSLTNSHASAAVPVTGIAFSSSTGTNLVSRNTIYGLGVSSSSATATLNGLYAAGGAVTFQNNMIDLGNSNVTSVVVGIDKVSSSAEKFFHNSVYIGGSSVTGLLTNSFAFRRTASAADSVFNNIFYNAR